MRKKHYRFLFPLITLFLILAIIEMIGQLSSITIQIAKYGTTSELKNHIIRKSSQRILCIGESTTEGGYPIELQKKLDLKYPNKFQVIDSGYQAVSTDFFVHNIEKIYNKTKPDKAIIMLGINDQFLISNNGDHTVEKKQRIKMGIFDSFYLVRLTKYVIGIFNEKTYDERFLRLLNARRQNEAISLFVNNYDEIKRRDVLLKGVEILRETLDLGEMDEFMQEVYEDIIERFPNDLDFRIEKLWFLSDIGENELIKKEIEEMRSLQNANHFLGTFVYHSMNNNKLAKEFFEKAISKNEDFDLESKAVFFILFENDKSKEKEINKVISSLSMEDRKVMTPFLKKIKYRSKKELDLSDEFEFFDKNQFSKKTLKNIKKVASFLSSRGVKVYISQYPLRSTKVFKNEDFKEYRIISNQQIFSDALLKYDYDELFVDSFGGDFGHMTELGKRILSENILLNIN